MACCSLKGGLSVSGSNEPILRFKTKGILRLSPSMVGSPQFTDSPSKDFLGKSMFVSSDRKGLRDWNTKPSSKFPIHAQASICASPGMRWWEKTLKPNMIEINLAQELVDFLQGSGDRLVIIDFYSPGCGGCKALHPKICQLAESNPNAIFLKVNYEELKKMCHALHIHVLPFFRFYRGAEGRLCSFSCTIATIKKFKDALAKHGTERCSLGPAKGLEEPELLSLASIGEISINFPVSSGEDRMEDLVLNKVNVSGSLGKSGNRKMGIGEEKTAVLHGLES